MHINPEDVIVETISDRNSNWLGVQRTGCKVTHKPTGKVFTCVEHRSSYKNRNEAFRQLTDYLFKNPKDIKGIVPIANILSSQLFREQAIIEIRPIIDGKAKNWFNLDNVEYCESDDTLRLSMSRRTDKTVRTRSVIISKDTSLRHDMTFEDVNEGEFDIQITAGKLSFDQIKKLV